MDSFTIAVLAGGAIVILVLALVLVFDKGKAPVPSATAPKAGKR